MSRRTGYVLLNLTGLSVGLAAFCILTIYVVTESTYDTFHKGHENIYRVVDQLSEGRTFRRLARTSALLGPLLLDQFPEVDEYVRLLPADDVFLQAGDVELIEDGILYADRSFLDVFSFELLAGDEDAALSAPNTILLTRALADKLFDKDDPIGRTLRIEGEETFTVTGIIEEAPISSHIQFDAIASFATLEPVEQYWQHFPYTYIRLRDGSDLAGFRSKLSQLVNQEGWWTELEIAEFDLQDLAGIHLDSDVFEDLQRPGSRVVIAVLSIVAILILLIACLNYVNLSTARALERAREVGIRKVVGATKGQLVQQYLSESFIFAFASALLAILLIYLSVPFLENDLGITLGSDGLPVADVVWIMPAAVLFVGFAAGIYPALVLTSYEPSDVLRRSATRGGFRSPVREGLVLIQFAICIGLISCTIIVSRQAHYLVNKPLGFQTDQIVAIPLVDELRNHLGSFSDELADNPHILAVSAASGAPNQPEIGPLAFRDKTVDVHYLLVDYNYVDLLEMEVVEGRTFSEAISTDATQRVVINESAAKLMGWTNAIGKSFTGLTGEVEVIGVVRDFHTLSLRHGIAPTILQIAPPFYDTVLIRYDGGSTKSTLEFVDGIWHKHVGDRPLTYTFLDESIAELYDQEKSLSSFLKIFSAIAILLACLGLFGLTSFNTELRAGEMGLRKILGATATQVAVLLTRRYVILVLLGGLLVGPVAYLLMASWLEDFAYHVRIYPFDFAVPSILALLIALTTTAYHIWKTRSQPLRVLDS